MVRVKFEELIRMNRRYILEPYKGRVSRHACPSCGKPYEFTRYMDSRTGEIIAEQVGRCNRIDKCGYHYTPKQYFADYGIKQEKPFKKAVINQTVRPQTPTYIDPKIFAASLKKYEENNFIKYLDSIFDFSTVNDLINIYKIGTSKRYNGNATVFWQIDRFNNIRTGKIIKYDESGHRIKGKNNWVHSVLNLENFVLKQCLFGEHLLPHCTSCKVGIVESEKTAVILQAKLPELIWLASGGADGINQEKVKALKGREVILFPDASEGGRIFKKWEQKAKQFGFEISDYLEQYATDLQKSKGIDIADFV